MPVVVEPEGQRKEVSMSCKDDKILLINPDVYFGSHLSQDQNLDFFKPCDAVWVHSKDPKDPHAKLSIPSPSGEDRCSNAYFNCPEVTKYPNLCEILAWQLVLKLAEVGINKKNVDYVVGSPYSAITFSYAVAGLLNAVHVFAQKDPSDPKGKKMIFKNDLPEDVRILQVEELITTSGTFKKVRKAVIKKNPGKGLIFLPTIGAIVYRPAELPKTYQIGNTAIDVVSLIEKAVWAIEKSNCELCNAGSEALSPKSHWAELVGK